MRIVSLFSCKMLARKKTCWLGLLAIVSINLNLLLLCLFLLFLIKLFYCGNNGAYDSICSRNTVACFLKYVTTPCLPSKYQSLSTIVHQTSSLLQPSLSLLMLTSLLWSESKDFLLFGYVFFAFFMPHM